MSIEALHTITLHIYIYEGDEPLWSIEHRDHAYHYTLYIDIYIEEGDEPPDQSITEALHTTTLLIYIYIYIYIYRKEMNPPGQLSIEALHTITLHIYIERGRR